MKNYTSLITCKLSLLDSSYEKQPELSEMLSRNKTIRLAILANNTNLRTPLEFEVRLLSDISCNSATVVPISPVDAGYLALVDYSELQVFMTAICDKHDQVDFDCIPVHLSAIKKQQHPVKQQSSDCMSNSSDKENRDWGEYLKLPL